MKNEKWKRYIQPMVDAKFHETTARIQAEEAGVLRDQSTAAATASQGLTDLFLQVGPPPEGGSSAEEHYADMCRCPEPLDPEDYTLGIDCGSIEITHIVCGKRPWFMYDDWNESVSMYPAIPVRVTVTGDCGSYHPDQIGCDCGPEINLSNPKGKK